MKTKLVLIVLAVFLVGTVLAGEIANINPSTFSVTNIKSGDSFRTNFNFDYLSNGTGNYNNAPIIFRVNITAEDPTPAVWKGDFSINAIINQYLLQNNLSSRTINLNCSENSTITFHAANGIDLRYINNTPAGTFYCYNPNYYLLQLGSRNGVSMNFKTNFRLYPGNYNITIEFLQTTDYAIPLNKKWNLVSFPFPLENNSVEYLFNKSTDIESIWSYQNGAWQFYTPGDNSSTLKEIVPGRGYWIKSSRDTFILVGIENLFSPKTTPPQVSLNTGWNLIGHYGLQSKNVYCNLFSITNPNETLKWNSLYGFDSWNDKFEELNETGTMNPGEGYWVMMNSPGTYFPSTICIRQ